MRKLPQYVQFRKITPQKALRAVFIVVVSVWVLVGIFWLWNYGARNTADANYQQIESIRDSLQSTPTLERVQAGQSSGYIAPTVYAYEQTLQTIDSASLSGANIITQGHNSLSMFNATKNAETKLADMSKNVGADLKLLQAVQKFIEYNPKVALAPVFGKNAPEAGETERLDRTKEGLASTKKAVLASGHDSKDEVVEILDPVIEQAKGLNKKNAPDWYATVLAAQKKILALLNTKFTAELPIHNQELINIATDYRTIIAR